MMPGELKNESGDAPDRRSDPPPPANEPSELGDRPTLRNQEQIEPQGLEPLGLDMTPERKAQFESDKARIEARKAAGEHSTHDLPDNDPGSNLRRHEGVDAEAPPSEASLAADPREDAARREAGSDSMPAELDQQRAMAAADEGLEQALAAAGAQRTQPLTDQQVADLEQALRRIDDDGPNARTAATDATTPAPTQPHDDQPSPISGDAPSVEQDLVVDEGMTAAQVGWAAAAGVKFGLGIAEPLGHDVGLETPEPKDVADAIEAIQPWVETQRDRFHDWSEERRYPSQ